MYIYIHTCIPFGEACSERSDEVGDCKQLDITQTKARTWYRLQPAHETDQIAAYHRLKPAHDTD